MIRWLLTVCLVGWLASSTSANPSDSIHCDTTFRFGHRMHISMVYANGDRCSFRYKNEVLHGKQIVTLLNGDLVYIDRYRNGKNIGGVIINKINLN